MGKSLASCPEGLVSPSDISTQDKDGELQDTKGAQAWLTQDCGSPSPPSSSGSGSPHWLSCQDAASGLTTVGKLEGQHAALVQMQLVLVGLGVVQDLYIAALHAHGQPLSSGAVTQGEDLQGQTVQCPLCLQGWSSPLGRVRFLLTPPSPLTNKPNKQLSVAPLRYPRGVICIPLRKLALEVEQKGLQFPGAASCAQLTP